MTITSDRASVSPAVTRLLIANRGEVAIRIARACAELGVASVAAYPEDDRLSLHVRKADDAVRVPGRGAAAYLDGAAIVAAAKAAGCDAIHPGYRFPQRKRRLRAPLRRGRPRLRRAVARGA